MKTEAFAPLAEPYVVQDTYVTGLHDVEHLGEGEYRFTFYVKQRSSLDGIEELVVAARIIMCTSSILSSIQQTMRMLGRSCCGAVSRLQH